MIKTSYTNRQGVVYHLHTKVINLRSHFTQRIYYYRKGIDKEFVIDEIPAGYTVDENVKTGLPFLKKIK